MEQNSQGQNPQKSGWSWIGFLFPAYYYAGYGKLKKGIIMAIIVSIPVINLVTALVVGIYGGINAKRELPIKEVPFNWGNVGIVLLVITVFLGLLLLIRNLVVS
ncbi:hypothetical protein [Campylobacter mucosalis]|uniref:hypothetical protein n=1 Tax=Campylobacter mucosalis TaxID=202 RepID=UPI001470586D|nr:hypothetical protein [Campylobacter mucosalis]